MAIGDNGTNKLYEPTYYSRVKIRNDETNTNLSINYRSGLMIIDINNVDQSNGFKVESAATIYLSPAKAHLLVSEMNAFLKYREEKKIDENKAFGVNTGMGEKVSFVAFSTNSKKDIIMTIGKFDGQGVVTESKSYTFAKDYNYSLEWSNLSANELNKVYDNNLDILTLKQAIEDFGRGMSGAFGYSTLDLNRYEYNKEIRKFDQIFDKLGIERRSYGNGNYNGGGTNNFLSNASSSSSRNITTDEIEDLLI